MITPNSIHTMDTINTIDNLYTITSKSEKIPNFVNITEMAGFIEDCFDNITMEICQSLDLDRDNMIDPMGKLIMEFDKVLKEGKLQ